MCPIVAARPPTRTIAAMPQPDRNPLAATRRLLVDGTNLLYALSKTSTASPPAALIGRLRGAIPAATTIELVFDGPPERGLRNERIASGVIVRYSGGRTADNVILTMIEDVRLIDGPDGTATLLIVTDDRDVRHGARLRGARTAGSAWLRRRPGLGLSRRPRRPPCRATATPPRWTARAGRGGVARRPRKATRRRLRRRAGLVGCGRESDRHPEPDLDPDPGRHVHLRDARLGLP